jgi:hypothetical protein
MYYKAESFISPLGSETRLFQAGSDCCACCDRFRSLEDSEDVIEFMIFILIFHKLFLEAFASLVFSNPAFLLSFLDSLWIPFVLGPF